MPEPRKTQKQIAQSYAGNLRYFKSLHPLRRTRLLLTLTCFLLAVGVGLIYLNLSKTSRRLATFNSPGGISQAHSGKDMNCQSCHDPTIPNQPLNPSMITSALDAKCEVCHVNYTFHQPNVVLDHSCIACHHEHRGTGPMAPVTDSSCISCHGDAATMAASTIKGLQQQPSDFVVLPKDVFLLSFHPPRPASGYTQVFQSFAGGHPDFQIQRDHLTDPDTLKFNHKVHLSGAIPEIDGHKLDCAYCHKPEGRGAYMQPITFAKNCQACHSLQLDPTLPGFQIPHPASVTDTNSVRNFLLTLPTQFSNYAVAREGLTAPDQIASFVNQHMQTIRERTREGVDLEQEVFFSSAKYVHFNGAMPMGTADRSLFPGCVYCHEVKTLPVIGPTVTKPEIPNRWYIHAKFDHAAHLAMNCNACHSAVAGSTKTSDILLPDKASCVTCHSPQGGVISTCVTCHDFHNSKNPDHDSAAAPALRKMMLGHP